MNIESLANYISEFRIRIVDSGFKRDVQDYIQSLPNNQSNIIVLREIAEKLRKGLEEIYSSDLPDALNGLFPTQKVRPFTEKNYLKDVTILINNTTITQAEFFTKLQGIVQQLHTELQKNESEIAKIETFIVSYVEKDVAELSDARHALVSIIFKDKHTVSSLKELVDNLKDWNSRLLLYHQLLKSESPKDIHLVQVQNGSIDFIVNLDVDIAVNLADVFATGFKAFSAYFTYIKLVKPITETYFGNPKLINSEKEREQELLKNIGDAIESKIKQQHKEAQKRSVNPAGADKMIEEVKKLVTTHIVKGNDIKLIALPKTTGTEEADQKKDELRGESAAAKNALRNLPPEERTKLLTMYSEINPPKT